MGAAMRSGSLAGLDTGCLVGSACLAFGKLGDQHAHCGAVVTVETSRPALSYVSFHVAESRKDCSR